MALLAGTRWTISRVHDAHNNNSAIGKASVLLMGNIVVKKEPNSAYHTVSNCDILIHTTAARPTNFIAALRRAPPNVGIIVAE